MDNIKQTTKKLYNNFFAVVPPQYKTPVANACMALNYGRLFIVCLIIVAQDIFSLLINLIFDYARPYLFYSCLTYLVKILITLLFAHLFKNASRKYLRGYKAHLLFACFIAFWLLSELFIAAFSPNLTTSFLRLVILPFILSAALVISRLRATCLLFVIFTVYTLVLPIWAGGVIEFTAHDILKLWGVGFVFSLLLAFSTYSWFVKSQLQALDANAARNRVAEFNERISKNDIYDSLTHLRNRRWFNRYMDIIWPRLVKKDTPVSIAVIDIDCFKKYTDCNGMLEADECICLIGDALNQAVFETGIILARFGHDEFIAFCYGRSHTKMLEVASVMRQNVLDLALPHPQNDNGRIASISIGIASHTSAALATYETLISWAEGCLFYAKRTGRGRVIYTHAQQGNYTDIFGVNLVGSSDEATLENEYFSDNSLTRMLDSLGSNCNFIYSVANGYISFSSQAENMFNLPAKLPAKSVNAVASLEYFSSEDRKRIIHIVRSTIADKRKQFSVGITYNNPQENISMPLSLNAEFVYNKRGKFELCFGTIISIAHLNEYTGFLKNQSFTNTVTMLPNRNKLDNDLYEILKEKDVNGYLIFLDIRQFNEINSSYSHSIGDSVLRNVAQILTDLAGPGMEIYNYNMDQFVYLAKGISQKEALNLMQDIQAYFKSNNISVSGIEVRINFAVVALPFCSETTNKDQLLLDIDLAVQGAKMGNCHMGFFDETRKTEALSAVEMRHMLKKAAEKDFEGFELFYQPIVSAKTFEYIGAEALLRWSNGQGQIASPEIFVPILEEADLMAGVESWILRTATRQCREWIDLSGNDMFFININLCTSQLGRTGLTKEVQQNLSENMLFRNNITLEVTESFPMAGYNSAFEALQNFRKQGIRVAIDDFGTGYSSLSYLSSLPANEVKIDRSFVRSIEYDSAARQFLLSIISMLKSMNFIVCVEGVETLEQAMLIREANAEHIQGFHFGRPTPPKDFYGKFLCSKPEQPVKEHAYSEKMSIS